MIYEDMVNGLEAWNGWKAKLQNTVVASILKFLVCFFPWYACIPHDVGSSEPQKF
jgi:hypothetical protein